ncbi:MAG: NlpC/P60 family protein [Candidatus Staskawiczbacteria bacterium]|nr:NlpC/P60 family protein [Candidatus Staskawiczbacteria bacterium]
MIGINAKIYYNHAENLNSSSVMTDSAGTIAETLDYFPFGAIRIDTHPSTGSGSSAFSEQRKYIGQEFDADTGLNYLNARYYNSALARFTSEDPVALAIGDENQIKQLTGQDQQTLLANPQALNSYSYANDNPINRSDPSGRASSLVSIISSLVSAWKSLLSTVIGGGDGSISPNHLQNKSPSSISIAQPSYSSHQSPKIQTTQYYNGKYAAIEEKLVGKPYVWGANGPDSVDCSGAVIYGIRQSANPNFGDRGADDLYRNYSVSSDSRSRGTVTFYDYTSDGRIDHVTTNVGNGSMVNPLNPDTGVLLTPTNYQDDYTYKQGGSIYHRQLDWQKITQ